MESHSREIRSKNKSVHEKAVTECRAVVHSYSSAPGFNDYDARANQALIVKGTFFFKLLQRCDILSFFIYFSFTEKSIIAFPPDVSKGVLAAIKTITQAWLSPLRE